MRAAGQTFRKLDAHDDPNAKDKEGWTVLSLTGKEGHTPVLQLLEKAGGKK
jgi:ankyrin repeat protein